MEVVINTSYGTITSRSASRRYDPQFIEDVKSGRFVGAVIEGSFGGYAETLKVVNIPDEASDHMIINYDGIESVIYCLDGHLYVILGDEDAKILFDK